ncbi:amino acid adenylation domain-containing protein [Bailinhaonella thermotolerans]|uniref:Amino acid adenylation domain-containing protein n=1 Tax=Bailinhaonella thermotolerans TaxID=1070861 RepID=A0A3A4B7K5_9ACTN|nr:amino acid adenylation domain-containing protein [Bailinhaonella thermotolerans]RJL30088.1 amino acid adenylation domain-containing protein [Bailinhaonella thermotolerans]
MTLTPARPGRYAAVFAGPVTDYPREAALHELFAAVAARRPYAPAIRAGRRELSYGELDARSRALAARLREAGVRPGDAVGVCGGRSPEAIVAVLGVLRAGAAYVPLDEHSPPARLNAMAEDSGVRAAVVLPGARCRVRRLGVRVALTDGPDPGPGFESPAVGAGACAYVTFTSGSTGRPKPVAVPHRGVVRLALSDPDLPRPGAADRVLHGYAPSSGASTIEIWSGLLGGSCLVIAEREELLSPVALERRLREDEVTIAYLTTSVFHHVARTRPHAFAGLRFVSAGGEAMDPALAREVVRACPSTEVANLYGPAENTVVSTVHFVRGLPEDARTVPIGRPLANSTCRVLLPDGSPAGRGEEGELYVGGDGLALGYPGDPRLTAERFVTFDDGERLYRTGDRVTVNPDGVLEHLGRLDRRLKLRGRRVEPDEVEARLRDHPSVGEAVVGVEDDGLVAYLTPAVPGRPADPSALRRFCAKWLPAPAVPRAIHQLAAFPLTPAGKVDRAGLAALVRERTTAAPPGADPGDEAGLRAVVASAWEAALGVRPEAGDDFFLIGGDSLLAAEVVNRTRAVLGLDAAHGSRLIRALLDAPTVEGFAGAVADALAGTPGPGTAVDFEAEARLGFTLPHATGPAPRPGDPADVLLTGATGFVGAFLLDRLLGRTSARVHCPVRARDTVHARRRVLATLDRYGLSVAGREDRVICFPGDLTDPELGLGPSHLHELGRTLDLIVHCGARVNLVYPYPALRDANVEGTRAIVRLAARRRVPVHFLSTVAVLAGFGAAGTRHVNEDVPLAHADRLTMGYAESKWVAERVLREAARQGLPVAVYRPYEVTGDRRTGVCNTETAICSLFKMIAETGFAPDIALPMDFVPVDHVADAIVRIATGRTTASETYHLTNPRPATLADVVERMRATGFEIETLPYARWVGELIRHVTADPASPAAPFVSLYVDRGGGTDGSVEETYAEGMFPRLGRRNTEAALAGSGLTCPPVDTTLIDHYLEHLFASGFIRRPRAGRGMS